MVMNGFDIDFDGKNDFYAVNAIPFHYDKHPIKIKVGETGAHLPGQHPGIRPDQLVSHLHANFLPLLPDRHQPDASEYTDTIIAGAGQRGILEFTLQVSGQVHVPRSQDRVCRTGLDGRVRGGGMRHGTRATPPEFSSQRARTQNDWPDGRARSILLAGVIALFLVTNGAGLQRQAGCADREPSLFERTVLRPGDDRVARPQHQPAGRSPLRPVNINDAIWPFAAAPEPTIPRLGQADHHV